ncbi:MAG: adenylyltransferase/cytidyltransferase family protein [Phycisphaerales bacterium]|nr:adenylyltransferase/cytidyltransferase family protein [Phycisphaerales bacterium]
MPDSEPKTVMVSGCFDLLHSGHVAFLREAAGLGRLCVCVGSDRTVLELKGRPPINTESERAFMLGALLSVDEVRISAGSGLLDFLPELDAVRPDVFFVNADGDSPEKRALIESRGVEYRVARREPHGDLVARSTTDLRDSHTVPYRLDLAGGWLDQPYVSALCPGPVVNVSLEPTHEFNHRSGMASSTRETAIGLWGPRLPADDREKLAKMIFAVENPPGTVEVAGSQDPIGIVYPGLKRINYAGSYWPESIDTVTDDRVLRFLEDNLWLVPLGPRRPGLDILATRRITEPAARRLADAANRLWDAALACDAPAFGLAMTASLEAQAELYPAMIDDDIRATFERYQAGSFGHKVSGAGGGGYAVFFGGTPADDAIRLTIRRED